MSFGTGDTGSSSCRVNTEMKTYHVPVFIGIVANSPEEAWDKAYDLMEACAEDNNPEELVYVDIGSADEIICQLS